MQIRPHHIYVLLLFGLIVCCFPAFRPETCHATPGYADRTGFECIVCHVNGAGGGPLTESGKKFLNDIKAGGEYKELSFPQRVVRLLIGYFHIMAAIIWFGTIMYVHILLKPAYASKGLPRGELRLGWISMVVILITGILLTIARVPSLKIFYTTKFGILLSIKIFLFFVMLSSALIVTIFIRPRLRKGSQSPAAGLVDQNMNAAQLAYFDGKEGRPAYIAYKGIVYNVTQGKLWKSGMHVMKHAAGSDLTDSLKNAPHGEDKIFAMPQVGTLTAAEKPQQPFHVRLFYFIAYMNLILVFVITFVIALWRWW